MLPALLTRALSPALEARHGATVGAGEALLALHGAGVPCVADEDPDRAVSGEGEGEVDLASRVVGLVAAVEKARLYRGKGGEVMRAAVCRYVECLAIVRQPLDKGPGPATGPKSLRSSLLASVEDSLKHPTADIRDAAVRALGQFALAYMCKGNPEAGAKRLVVKLAGTLREDPNPAARRGAALALGVMPATLSPRFRPPSCIIRIGDCWGRCRRGCCCWDWENGGDGDHGDREGAAEDGGGGGLEIGAGRSQGGDCPRGGRRSSRRRGARVRGAGLAGLLDKLAGEMLDRRTDEVNAAERQGGVGQAVATVAGEVIDTLLGCMEDYCTDNRGDVGSWVREAAMEGAPRGCRGGAGCEGRRDGGGGGGGGDCFATGARNQPSTSRRC